MYRDLKHNFPNLLNVKWEPCGEKSLWFFSKRLKFHQFRIFIVIIFKMRRRSRKKNAHKTINLFKYLCVMNAYLHDFWNDWWFSMYINITDLFFGVVLKIKKREKQKIHQLIVYSNWMLKPFDNCVKFLRWKI